MSDILPNDVVSLLGRLDSVMQLEILIALHDTEEPLTPALLTRRIGGSPDQATRCLESLVSQGMAGRDGQPDGSVSYRSNDHDETIDRLADLYISRKVRVVTQLLRSV